MAPNGVLNDVDMWTTTRARLGMRGSIEVRFPNFRSVTFTFSSSLLKVPNSKPRMQFLFCFSFLTSAFSRPKSVLFQSNIVTVRKRPTSDLWSDILQAAVMALSHQSRCRCSAVFARVVHFISAPWSRRWWVKYWHLRGDFLRLVMSSNSLLLN